MCLATLHLGLQLLVLLFMLLSLFSSQSWVRVVSGTWVQELGFKGVSSGVLGNQNFDCKEGEMAAKKAVGRIIHFANLPLKLLLPSSRENITEVAFKTIPSASKVRNSTPLPKSNMSTITSSWMLINWYLGRSIQIALHKFSTLLLLSLHCSVTELQRVYR